MTSENYCLITRPVAWKVTIVWLIILHPSYWPFHMWEYTAGAKIIIVAFKFNNYRLLIAVMYFNENFGRQQAITKDGKEE